MPPEEKKDLDTKPDTNPAPPAGGAPDPKSFLLPKKEVHAPDTAQRVSAGALFEQEAKAAQETPATPIGAVSKPAAPPPPPPKEDSVVRPIETYGADITRMMREGTVSVASIAAAEAERRARATVGEPVAPQELSPQTEPSGMRPVLIIAGAILILCALGIAAALYWRFAPVPVQTTGGLAPFVAVDDTLLVPIGADASHLSIMANLESARERVNLPVGLVEWLYVGIATTSGTQPAEMQPSDLLTLLAPDMSQDLARTVVRYLLGVHSYDENQTFLIMRVDSYQQAYAGMLAWEPYMQRDLAPLFTRTPAAHITDAPAVVTATTTASSTAATATTTSAASTTPATTTTPVPVAPAEPVFAHFSDAVVRNHDARVITNSAGDILLLWTFLDRNTLVITTNEYTLGEIIRRVDTTSVIPQP